MLRVCCDCRRQLDDNNNAVGEKLTETQQGNATHGFCVACYTRFEAELDAEQAQREAHVSDPDGK